jgi:bifunctional DNase/RNase
MKKRELKILGLSNSQSQLGSYIIVLTDIKNNKKLPLIIKSAEAQRIALGIEGIKSPRPMIYDVLKSICDSYVIDIQEIFIHSLLEGIFYTKIVTSNGLEEIDIDCTAGDAITLSIIYNCPIYTTSEIMNIAGVSVDDSGKEFDEDEEMETTDSNKRILSVEDLQELMREAIENEQYEIAAELRDKIEELGKLKKES